MGGSMNQKELYSDGELTRKRWMVLLASCMINLCIGSLYTWSVFSSPLAAHLSQVMGIPISPSDLSIVFSIGNSFGFITMIIGGALNQAIGARRVVFGGGILFGVGFILCGIAQSIGLLILGYGICSGLAMGFIYGMTISNTVKFFPDRAGLAGGLTTAAYGISSVLLPPLANGLIEWLGVGRSFIVIGGFIIVVVGFFSLWIIPCPPGFLPAGFRPAGTGLESQEGKDGGADYSWKEMMTSPLFYIMLIMLYFGAVSGLMMLSQAFNMARDMIGMSTAQAALVVSVLALFNTFGRIL